MRGFCFFSRRGAGARRVVFLRRQYVGWYVTVYEDGRAAWKTAYPEGCVVTKLAFEREFCV